MGDYASKALGREESWKEGVKHFIPLKRGSQSPEDIAEGVLFLCSDMADAITGQTLNIDGGATMN